MGVTTEDESWSALVAGAVGSTPEATGDGVAGVRSATGSIAGWVLTTSADEALGGLAGDLGVDAVEDVDLFASTGGVEGVSGGAESADGSLASSRLSVDEAGIVAWEQLSAPSDSGVLSSEAEGAAASEAIPLEAALDGGFGLAADGSGEEECD